jgi:hypothetical protein
MREDMQDQSENPLVDPMGECTTPLINLGSILQNSVPAENFFCF